LRLVGKKVQVRPCLKNKIKLGLVAHACNPSYSGDRDQEDHGSRLPLANSSMRPYLKKSFIKIGLAVTQGEGPEFKPQQTRNKIKTKGLGA
jgi:hypothetical protein